MTLNILQVLDSKEESLSIFYITKQKQLKLAFSCVRLIHCCSVAGLQTHASLTLLAAAVVVWRSWTDQWPLPPLALDPKVFLHAPLSWPRFYHCPLAPWCHSRSRSGQSLIPEGWDRFLLFLKTFCAFL